MTDTREELPELITDADARDDEDEEITPAPRPICAPIVAVALIFALIFYVFIALIVMINNSLGL